MGGGCCWFPFSAFQRGPEIFKTSDPEEIARWADATFDGRPEVSVMAEASPVSLGVLHREAESRGYEYWGSSANGEFSAGFLDFRLKRGE